MPSVATFAGTVPANYDQYLGPLLFEPYAKDLITRLSNRFSGDILELACGTGRVTRSLVDNLENGGTIMATDLNPDMIAVAKDIVYSRKVKWQVEDAQSLSFNNNSFDTVVCQFGVMFFPEKLKALRETYRVLRKEGLFIFNAWDRIDNIPIVAIINTVLKEQWVSESPDFLEKGPYSFSDPQLMKELMQQAGFTDIKVELVKLQSHYDSADQVVKGYFDGSPLGSFLQGQDMAKQKMIRDRIREELINNFGEQCDDVLLQAFVCEGRRKDE